jgi:hypothetical protein
MNQESSTVDPDRAWTQRPTAELPQYQSTAAVDPRPFTMLPPGVRPPIELCARQVVTPEQETKDILEEEANRLALWLDGAKKTIPHRVEIAVLREIARLRRLANWACGSVTYFTGMLPPEIPES